MAKKQAGENSKKVAGNAKKAEAAAIKAAAENNKKAQAEAEEWSKGAKSNSKAEAAAAKKAEADRKKAEKDALLKAEEADAPSGPKNSKKAEKKKPAVKRGLDLSQLDDSPTSASPSALNASGIDNALDALALTSNTKEKIDRHPERRFKAAYAEFEERRLVEMEKDGSGAGLRKNQRQERIRKEFEKSPLNPYNQVTGRYDSTKSELEQIRQSVQAGVEARLGGN
ncbi:hypothetical protein MFRU_005g04230 [Monilinia fructicola]|uniref:DUF1014 domain-containing protein n=1 Tax=Monilinia fructicola TaxID=38448 RepID=A0A5M9JRA2_MONFR|nr:hypothetical protein EYC84_002652 [Monilinia fructicola]KAG4033416.1 hypothetical protein MFRU_005g04230 [Monilinia fructicola]